MRVSVTGASGLIGSADVPGLTGAGHEVLGLARPDSSAAAITAAGAAMLRGDLYDLDALRAGASDSWGRFSPLTSPHPSRRPASCSAESRNSRGSSKTWAQATTLPDQAG